MSAYSPETCACTHDYVGPSMAGYCGGGTVLTFLTIMETFINGRCEIRDPCNRVTPKNAPDFEYDFIVAGGGTAGPVVAARLSENPDWKVLLLEAGDDEPTAAQVPMLLASYWGNPATDWLYKTDPQSGACLSSPGKRCSWPRAKMLGGCSVFNGMMYMRGNPRDYDNWVKKDGLTDWSFADVLPYFKKSEDNRQIGTLVDSKYHSAGGYLTVQQFRHQADFTSDILKAAEELGFGVSKDLNGDKLTGFTLAQALNRDGMRLSAARAFLRPASKRPNLHVMVNSTVTKINVDPATKNVIGVEFTYNGKKLTAKANKEVILTAGVINTPQILLLSGIGPKEDLAALKIPVVKDLPGVGKNLHNHVAFSLPYQLDKVDDLNLMNWVAVTEYLLSRTGTLASSGNWQLTAKMNSKYADPDGQHPDIQAFISGYGAYCSNTGSVHEMTSPDAKRSIGVNAVNLHPKSRGYVALRSADPFEPPIMQPNYLTHEDDVKRLIEGVKMMSVLEKSKLLQDKYGIRMLKDPISDCLQQGQWGSDAYWECAIRFKTDPENHQVGTCKMGPSTDNFAVLDSRLRVYGINGLRVMDASAIPTVTSGNTATPTIMIAERGTDFIKEDWGFKNKTQNPVGTNTIGNRFSDTAETLPNVLSPANPADGNGNNYYPNKDCGPPPGYWHHHGNGRPQGYGPPQGFGPPPGRGPGAGSQRWPGPYHRDRYGDNRPY